MEQLHLLRGELLLAETEEAERPGRHKPKENKKADSSASLTYDRCQTPPNAVGPLVPFLPPGAIIWEPAAGEGYIVGELERHGFRVTASDILTGQNFFTYAPPRWDVIVTNPPYSDKYKWLLRCYLLGKPFALLVPAEARYAQASIKLYRRFKARPEELMLDRRINFKMPLAGWTGSGAQFPVTWLCHKLIPGLVEIGHVLDMATYYQETLL